MEKFVHRQNLERFAKQISETTDEARQLQLVKLLAEEKAKDQPPAAERPVTGAVISGSGKCLKCGHGEFRSSNVAEVTADTKMTCGACGYVTTVREVWEIPGDK